MANTTRFHRFRAGPEHLVFDPMKQSTAVSEDWNFGAYVMHMHGMIGDQSQ